MISQREAGERAAAAARSRARAGSSGPSSLLSPARSARACRAASGPVTSARGGADAWTPRGGAAAVGARDVAVVAAVLRAGAPGRPRAVAGGEPKPLPGAQ